MTPNEPDGKKNNSLLIVLIVVIGFCALGIPILAAILFPVFAQAKLAAKRANSTSHLKQLGIGMMMYAGDNDDRYPQKERWCDDLRNYIKSDETWQSPFGDPAVSPRCDYAMIAARAGQRQPPVLEAPTTPILIESGSSKWNQSGHYELLPDPARYEKSGKDGGLVAYADGSVKLVTYESLGLGR